MSDYMLSAKFGQLEYINTGSCNETQTVLVKMSSLFSNFKLSTARISSKNAMRSPQSAYFNDVVRSFLCDFVDLESSIE